MPSICSLFSGIGGIDLGFEQAGFEAAWANEMDAAACKTYVTFRKYEDGTYLLDF